MKWGKRWRTRPGILRERVPSFPLHHQKHYQWLYPINKEETKLYHGLQRRWHSHSDAASVVSGRPLIAPLFCQFPSEDLSSGKTSKLVLASCFSFQFLIDLLLLEHSGKKTSGPEAELCLGGFACHSWWKAGLSTLYSFRSTKSPLIQSLSRYFDIKNIKEILRELFFRDKMPF